LNTITAAVYGELNNGDGYVTVWNADTQAGWAVPLDGIWRNPGWMFVIQDARITGGNWGAQAITGYADGTIQFPNLGGGPFTRNNNGTATWNGGNTMFKDPDIRGTWASAALGVSVQFGFDANGTWSVTGGSWGGGRQVTYNMSAKNFTIPTLSSGGPFTPQTATSATWAGTTFTKQ
jgi:hypothetical protein